MKACPMSAAAEVASWALPTTTPASLMALAELRCPPSVPIARRPSPGECTNACHSVGSRPGSSPTTWPRAFRSQTAQLVGQSSVRPAAAVKRCPKKIAGPVGAVGLPADGAVGRDGGRQAARAEAAERAQVLNAPGVGVADGVNVAVRGAAAAHRDAVVVDVLDEDLAAAKRGDLSDRNVAGPGHEPGRAAATQLDGDDGHGRARGVVAAVVARAQPARRDHRQHRREAVANAS